MSDRLNAVQLDALREVANTGSGHAAADLLDMLGHPFDVSVPRAISTDLADAMDVLGGAEKEVVSVAVGIVGDLDAMLVAIYPVEEARELCGLLGLDLDDEIGQSALSEVGNVLACAYAFVLGEMSGLKFDVQPPQMVMDVMGAIVSSLVAELSTAPNEVLLIDTNLSLRGSDTSMGVLFIPTAAALTPLLQNLGVA